LSSIENLLSILQEKSKSSNENFLISFRALLETYCFQWSNLDEAIQKKLQELVGNGEVTQEAMEEIFVQLDMVGE